MFSRGLVYFGDICRSVGDDFYRFVPECFATTIYGGTDRIEYHDGSVNRNVGNIYGDTTIFVSICSLVDDGIDEPGI